MDTAGRLWEPLERYLAAEGIELDDLELAGSGRGRVLRIMVDAPGGVDVDRIAGLSRGMSRLLDEVDPIAGPYSLEVSSPGLERRLRRPAQWQKAVGREVRVKTAVPVGERRSWNGLVDSVDEAGFQLDDGTSTVRIEYADVETAQTVFTWEKAPKPGRRRR